MMRLGLDLGSTSVKAVLIDDADTVVFSRVVANDGNVSRALGSVLGDRGLGSDDDTVRVAVTGTFRRPVKGASPALFDVPEVAALAAGGAHLGTPATDVISMGGHDAMWCRIMPGMFGSWSDFAISDLCAAGAGSFLEQQAHRLGFTPETLGAAALKASRAPTVAGRCAVFTKSDIIHLQQKGVPVDEIGLGLSMALVRTFQAQVLHGRRIAAPVLFVGGCARNAGMVRAMREVFGLDEDGVIVPPAPELVPCLGAARLADGDPVSLSTLRSILDGVETGRRAWVRLPPLVDRTDGERAGEPDERPACDRALLGVDVGSVSTNLALVDLTGTLVSAVYMKTAGRPLDALRSGLTALIETSGGQLPAVAGVAATGSGRHLAAHFLGGDLVKNEIAAQLRAAREHLPSVDTVLEIGGQDAKYIAADNGAVADFAMNRICSAGTGSFLEEQAGRLGLDIIGEFAACALQSKGPLDLGRRCTVFMESEMVAAQAAGATVNDVAAGLALSVARNYLDRVVGGRPIGEQVVFQGGTAANRAVVAAFEALLGRPISVHPHARVSGAIGAALLLMDARAEGLVEEQTRFRGNDACSGVLERTFACHHCSARCEVTRFRAKETVFHFGDACERYSARGSATRVADPLAVREALLLDAAGIASERPAAGTPTIGLLRTAHTMALLPHFAALVRAAGSAPILSESTTSKTLALGAAHLSSDTCLPIKAAYGHAVSLEQQGVERILVPAVIGLPGEERRSCSCLFGHHLPFMLRSELANAAVVAPELSLDMPNALRVTALDASAEALGLTARQVKKALAEGDRGLERFTQKMHAHGASILKSDADRIAVVLGRPYLVSDGYLNMGLGRHLTRLGMPVLPMDALPFEAVPLDETWDDLPWRYTRDMVRAAKWLAKDARLFPVVITSFGCGPDAFAQKHLERILARRPHLILEMDEHRSEAGLLTRLEAFSDEVDAHLRANKRVVEKPSAAPPKLSASSRLVMPYFADHVYNYAGIMRAAGYEVVVLPPPDHRIREKGEALSSGRECHPYAMVAGDLVNWLESPDARSGDVYFYPGTVVSCLLRQYGDGLDLMLQRLGSDRVRIVTASLDSWIPLVGLSLTIRMQAVHAAVNAMIRALCRIRPYERNSGETDTVYRSCLRLISEAAEAGGHFDAFETIADRLNRIARVAASRPVVGVAGDMYTRINDFASAGLFRKLEAAGLEVWPAPFATDVAELNALRRRRESFALMRPVPALRYTMAGRVMSKQTRRVDRIFSRIDGMKPEPSAAEMEALVAPYLGSAGNPLVVVNIGRMRMYADAGVSGILNASCINCMVGAASEAFQSRMKQDIGDVPLVSLVYGGSGGSVNDNRLEGFIHQVKRFSERRRG